MAQLTDAAPLFGPTPVAAAPAPAAASAEGSRANRAERVRAVVREHYAALWRWVRRLGVPESSAEDAAQQSLLVLAQRIADVEPGREKSFLFGVALRVAQSARREHRRWNEAGDDGALDALADSGPGAEDALDDRRARAVLDALLDAMPFELRSVFVLYEIEEMTMADIARTLGVPAGTIASRLRRARETFETLSRRAQAQAAARARGRR
jgi:RNA polymerase sigma-70 factor (ECF subfamily)